MSMLKEFRDFAVKGNVIDLAVGIIIGAAFGKIVDSLVNDIVMPAINAMFGGAVDFTNQYVVLSGSVPAAYDRRGDGMGQLLHYFAQFHHPGVCDLLDDQGG